MSLYRRDHDDPTHGLTIEQLAGMESMKPTRVNNAEATERALEKADRQAHEEFVSAWRGRELMPGLYRQFCCRCGIPFVVRDKTLRDKTSLLCEKCPPSKGQTIPATAFSPDRKLST